MLEFYSLFWEKQSNKEKSGKINIGIVPLGEIIDLYGITTSSVTNVSIFNCYIDLSTRKG